MKHLKKPNFVCAYEMCCCWYVLSRFLSKKDRSLPQCREGKELGSAVDGVTHSLPNCPAPTAWMR